MLGLIQEKLQLTIGTGEGWKPGLAGDAKVLALHPGLIPKGWNIRPGRDDTCGTTPGAV